VTLQGPARVARWDNRRSGPDLMDGHTGTVVCDALKTHEAGARGNDAIALAGCWAHVFRKFEEARPIIRRPTSP
jgi:hypothetical protein